MRVTGVWPTAVGPMGGHDAPARQRTASMSAAFGVYGVLGHATKCAAINATAVRLKGSRGGPTG